MLQVAAQEHPVSMQIFGADEQTIAQAAKQAQERGADIIDLNAGCPVKKINKAGAGCVLMKDEAKLGRLIEAAVKAVSVPVTLKTRIALNHKEMLAVRMAKLAENAGASAVTLHARAAVDVHAGAPNIEAVAQACAAVKIPVIGNGGVVNAQVAKQFLEAGCAGVMIGRGAQGNPWIFKQLTHFLRTGEILPKPTMQERAEVIIRHLDLLLKYKGDYIGPREMRKHATWYTRGITHGAILRDKFNKAEKREDFIHIINEYLLKA
jgi:nifR3 family TIM-barrel protein